MPTFEVDLPELGGSRLSAADLIATQLPEDLKSSTVVLNCSRVQSLSQSYTDELCKQILLVRSAAKLVLIRPPSRMLKHGRTSVKLRGLPELEIRN